jgi:TonB family protein
MRNFIWLAAFLAVTSGCVFAQEELPPSIDSGPLQFRSTSNSSDAPDTPHPDKNGVYALSAGIVLPTLLHGLPAVASPDDLPECNPNFVILSAVIDTDGHADVREVFTPRSTVCTNLAILSVKSSEYRPAKLDSRSVAVLACLRVPFDPYEPAVPSIQRCPTTADTVRRLRQEDNPNRQTAVGRAQEELVPSTNFGPMGHHATVAVPDELGFYSIGPGISLPGMIHREMAGPPEAIAECKGGVAFSALVKTDGKIELRGVYGPAEKNCQRSAMAAIEQSRYQPATLNGTGAPVPLLICIGVPFESNVAPPMPFFLPCPGGIGAAPLNDMETANVGETPELPPGVKPPVPINTPEPEYSAEARRKKIQGDVLVSVVVDENGLPAAPRIVRGLGYGLDENAIDAVMNYRFQPAVRNGKPVPARISVDVIFKLINAREH